MNSGATAAAITSWGDQQIVATVSRIGQGVHAATVTRSGSVTPSNAFNFTAYQSTLIPVTFSYQWSLSLCPYQPI